MCECAGVSINVDSSVSESSKSHAWCHFYLGVKIASFSVKVRDRLLTELWPPLPNPLEMSPQSPLPCIPLNRPPLHKPTHLRIPALTHTKPPPPPPTPTQPSAAEQSLFPHQIHKVYLTWAFTYKEHFPAVPLHWGNIVTNNLGVTLVPLSGAFTL